MCTDMNRDDVVDPVDAALQALLALIAEHTDDPVKTDVIRDFLLTCPPVNDWPAGSQERLASTCRYVMGLARSLNACRKTA